MAFSFMLPNFYGNAASTVNTPTPPTTGTGTGNVSARSIGTGAGSMGIDWTKADPSIVSAYNNLGITYSVPAGGYLFGKDTNPNSAYSKYGGSNPAANRAATNFYNYIGSLPTRSFGSLALERLYQQSGQQPAPGPSVNSLLQGYSSQVPPQYQNMLPMNQGGWTGPYSISPSRFSSTPRTSTTGSSIGW